MSYQKYSLEVLSHHPTFKNKPLRKYYVEGIETVGAWGDEPFEIVFKNHTSQRVQVKLSIDGTDILTGKLADTEVSEDMWLVNGYGNLSLKAWPETNNGGAQFVFTSATGSVALHIHGDLSARGIIAAAVYVEGYVEPIKTSPIVYREHHHYYDPYPHFGPYYLSDTTITCNSDSASVSNSVFNMSDARSRDIAEGCCDNDIRLDKLVSVGAGEHVDQKISYVPGLIKPLFTETVRMKYVWWDDLVTKLRTHGVASPHPSGFPGDTKKFNIDLKNTPRINSDKKDTQSTLPVYSRV